MVPDRSDASRPPRANERVPVDVFVRVAGADRDYPFRTRDLSIGGLFLYTRVGHLYPFSVGSEVSVELQDGARVTALRGKIVREVQPGTEEARRFPAGFAVRFLPLEDDVAEALRTLIGRHRTR